jgi:hypothetical protein
VKSVCPPRNKSSSTPGLAVDAGVNEIVIGEGEPPQLIHFGVTLGDLIEREGEAS